MDWGLNPFCAFVILNDSESALSSISRVGRAGDWQKGKVSQWVLRGVGVAHTGLSPGSICFVLQKLHLSCPWEGLSNLGVKRNHSWRVIPSRRVRSEISCEPHQPAASIPSSWGKYSSWERAWECTVAFYTHQCLLVCCLESSSYPDFQDSSLRSCLFMADSWLLQHLVEWTVFSPLLLISWKVNHHYNDRYQILAPQANPAQMTYLTIPCILLLKKLRTRGRDWKVLSSQISPLGDTFVICRCRKVRKPRPTSVKSRELHIPLGWKPKTSIFCLFKIAKPSLPPALLLLWFQKHSFCQRRKRSEQSEITFRTSVKSVA